MRKTTQFTLVLRRTLGFICQYIKKNSYPPTYTEICEHLGGLSKNAVANFIGRLVLLGYLEVDAHSARALLPTAAGWKQCDSLPIRRLEDFVSDA